MSEYVLMRVGVYLSVCKGVCVCVRKREGVCMCLCESVTVFPLVPIFFDVIQHAQLAGNRLTYL